MNAASSVFDEVGIVKQWYYKISYIYSYLLADIAELLPLGTVQVGEHVQEAARVQHLAVVAVVGGQDAAVDLTVARII